MSQSILKVPVPFFFEGAPVPAGTKSKFSDMPLPVYVSEYLATADGLALVGAFVKIKHAALRRNIEGLVEEIAGDED